MADHDPQLVIALAVTSGGSVFASMVSSAMVGAATPLVFDRLGIDPAIATGPIVTTTVDVLGILVYFGQCVSHYRDSLGVLSAVVTRTRPYRDSDLLVDFITGEHGRLGAVAGAHGRVNADSQGALEIGAHLQLSLSRRGTGGLYTLTDCEIVSVPQQARLDLGRFYRLACT